jgi:hypothetical protein
MEAAPGEALQRVCPHCSTLAYTAADRCPWCGGNYRRRTWPALLAVALVEAVIVVGGAAILISSLKDDVDRQVAAQVSKIQQQLDTSFAQTRAELDARLAGLGANAVPSPTPGATPTPAPTPTVTPAPTVTPTPTATPTP